MDSDLEQQLEPPSPKSHEVIETPAESIERLGGAIKKAKETIIGSGSLVKEIGNAGNAYLGIPKEMVVTPFKAMGELIRLHPIEATKKITQGAGEIAKDIVKIATTPSRLAIAGTSVATRTVGKTAKAPLKAVAWVTKSPLRVFDMLNKGINKLAI